MLKKICVLLTLLVFIMVWVGCEKNLTGSKLDNNPNMATEVPMESLLSAIEINSFLLYENFPGWLVSIWMQQMSGTAMTFENYGNFEVMEDLFNQPWGCVYTSAGLVDIRKLKAQADEAGNRTVAGMAKVLEALFIGTAASLWGDIPYSEIATSETPKLDKQSEVYAAAQQLLDEAIADLSSDTGFLNPAVDHYYAADNSKWIAVAHSLKARFYLEWAEVDAANYSLAMAEAQQGIASIADNFKSKHSDVADEENCWYQLERGRAGYVRAGKFMIDLLKEKNDPRLEIYFGKDQNGEYTGSDPGEGNANASYLNPDTYGSKSWSSEFVTWEEMQFIIAECQYATGDETGALSTLDNVLAGIEGKFNITLPRYSGTGLSGTQVLEAIMMEKYVAMFTNLVTWSDWKRTGYPVFKTTYAGRPIPHRFLYPLDERIANPNIPDPGAFGIYVRNENDPN